VRAAAIIAALAAGLFLAPAHSLAQTARPAPTPAAKAPARGGTVAILPGGNSKEPVSIEANKLEWFDKDQRAVYTGDVVVVQGETSLRAAALVIFMVRSESAGAAAPSSGTPSGNSSIRRMEATGPVTVIQKDQIGAGDRGEYDKASNTVTLIGNVTLSQGPNITTGDRLVYNLDTKQAIVESGQSKKRVQGVFIPGAGPKEAEKPAPGKPTDLQKPRR
jgi:lipopolysaccharide export system protein LptA